MAAVLEPSSFSRRDTLSLVPQTNSNTCFSVNKELDEPGFFFFFSSLVQLQRDESVQTHRLCLGELKGSMRTDGCM